MTFRILESDGTVSSNSRNLRFDIDGKLISIRLISDGRVTVIAHSDKYNGTIYYTDTNSLGWVMTNCSHYMQSGSQNLEIQRVTEAEMQTKVGEAFYAYTQHLINQSLVEAEKPKDVRSA